MGCDDPERLRRALNLNALIILTVLSLWFGSALAFFIAGLAKAKGQLGHMGRKIFHIAIFSGAVPAQMALGFWGVVTYGSTLSLLLLGLYWTRGDSVVFDSLSAPAGKDRSRRSVPVPFFSTVFGGLLGVLLVGKFAIVGYLVCGWGDAAGEIIGRRWGRRPYAPPFQDKGPDSRTMEGSLGVFLVGSFGALVAVLLLGIPLTRAVGVGLVCGGVGAGAEALSGQNTDNLWMQIIPALTAWWILV